MDYENRADDPDRTTDPTSMGGEQSSERRTGRGVAGTGVERISDPSVASLPGFEDAESSLSGPDIADLPVGSTNDAGSGGPDASIQRLPSGGANDFVERQKRDIEVPSGADLERNLKRGVKSASDFYLGKISASSGSKLQEDLKVSEDISFAGTV